MTHRAVLHYGARAMIVPTANVPELRKQMQLSIAYTEVLGNTAYDHYDVWSVLRGHSIRVEKGANQ
jgi:hypothetical protein